MSQKETKQSRLHAQRGIRKVLESVLAVFTRLATRKSMLAEKLLRRLISIGHRHLKAAENDRNEMVVGLSVMLDQ